MTTINLSIGYDLRATSKPIPNFSVLANVSSPFFEDVTKGNVERTVKRSINEPEWTFPHNTGISTYFKRHNGFKDQERHARITRNFVLRQGTFVKYYATGYNPTADTIYHEDNNRTIERVFDVPFILSFQPENEIYNRFGIQHMDEFESHLHMLLFYELNYASLRKHAVAPSCPEDEHNPVWSQRGYEAFRYHGYTFEQIGPKAGDKIKIEAFNTLYTIESIKDASPEFQHRWRKYWWKVFMRDSFDKGETVSEDVLNDPEQQGFINDLLGQTEIDKNTGAPIGAGYEFDISNAVDELKKDVLFRPPEVAKDVEDISGDTNFYPDADKFGQW